MPAHSTTHRVLGVAASIAGIGLALAAPTSAGSDDPSDVVSPQRQPRGSLNTPPFILVNRKSGKCLDTAGLGSLTTGAVGGCPDRPVPRQTPIVRGQPTSA